MATYQASDGYGYCEDFAAPNIDAAIEAVEESARESVKDGHEEIDCEMRVCEIDSDGNDIDETAITFDLQILVRDAIK